MDFNGKHGATHHKKGNAPPADNLKGLNQAESHKNAGEEYNGQNADNNEHNGLQADAAFHKQSLLVSKLVVTVLLF